MHSPCCTGLLVAMPIQDIVAGLLQLVSLGLVFAAVELEQAENSSPPSRSIVGVCW